MIDTSCEPVTAYREDAPIDTCTEMLASFCRCNRRTPGPPAPASPRIRQKHVPAAAKSPTTTSSSRIISKLFWALNAVLNVRPRLEGTMTDTRFCTRTWNLGQRTGRHIRIGDVATEVSSAPRDHARTSTASTWSTRTRASSLNSSRFLRTSVSSPRTNTIANREEHFVARLSATLGRGGPMGMPTSVRKHNTEEFCSSNRRRLPEFLRVKWWSRGLTDAAKRPDSPSPTVAGTGAQADIHHL